MLYLQMYAVFYLVLSGEPRSSKKRCGNMPIYWQDSSSESRAPDHCRLPGPSITYMKQGWTKMLWTKCSIYLPCTKPSSLATWSLVASCDMFFLVENSSHRPLLEWKYSGIVMRFSSYIGPTVTNQTCCLWLIHMYERLSMIYNPVVMRNATG